MKKILSTTAFISLLSFAPFFVSSAIAQSTTVTPTPVEYYNQATVTWPLVTGAKCYNIYYGRTTKTQLMWKHSVRCVSNTTWKYTIGYLKQNVSYSYMVAALDYSGKEISWTPIAPFVVSPMVK